MNCPTRIKTLPLTERQEKLWRFIRSCDRSPTFEEMALEMDVAVGAQITRLIDALEAKGFVRRTRARARSVIAIDPRIHDDALPLAAYSDSELIEELERRTQAALARRAA